MSGQNERRNSSFFTALLIVITILCPCLYATSKTSLYAGQPVYIGDEPYDWKIRAFLDSPANPSVLVLGSSFALAPALRTDDFFQGRKTRFDDWYSANVLTHYSKNLFLEHLLQENHIAASIVNLSMHSCMMSDYFLILDMVLADGKTPRLVICQLSVRDMMDHNWPDAHGTLAYRHLARLHDSLVLSREGQGIQFLARRMATELAGLPGRLRYTRQLVRQAILSASEKTCPRSTRTEPRYTKSANSWSRFLESWRRTCSRPSPKLFDEQSIYLENFLKLAQKNKIRALIVNTPVSDEAESYVDPWIRRTFLETVQSLANRYGAVFVDPGSARHYAREEFEDLVHMNAQGGIHLYTFISKAIRENLLLEITPR